LFGSFGRGTASSTSDIDIAIVSGDFAGKNIFERALLTKDAEIKTVRKFKVALDVLTLTPDEYRDPSSLIAGTIRKGIVVPVTPSARNIPARTAVFLIFSWSAACGRAKVREPPESFQKNFSGSENLF
jgi:uncharacterized protein